MVVVAVIVAVVVGGGGDGLVAVSYLLVLKLVLSVVSTVMGFSKFLCARGCDEVGWWR